MNRLTTKRNRGVLGAALAALALALPVAAGTTTTDPEWTEGGSVTIASGDKVILSRSTPRLASLVVGGTLVCSNWETKVSADAITISSKGKVTVGSASTDALTNRVWLSCGDLTIEAGGAIDVNNLGWLSKAWTGECYGPGCAAGGQRNGAAHGGYGSFVYDFNQSSARPASIYDSAAEPTLPGSAGCRNDMWGASTSGGGAVYISATGNVTVNGSIGASVTALASRGGSGSGGSVYVKCRTLSGSGSITADGGSTKIAAMKTWTAMGYEQSSVGGGGRIALVYDSSAQTAAQVAGLKVSADCGYFSCDSTKDSGESSYRLEADLGTVWMTDNTLLPSLLANGLNGNLASVTSYSHAGDLTLATGRVRFGASGAKNIAVSGSISIASGARLEVGGSYPQFSGWGSDVRDDGPATLSVGGSLSVAPGGRFDVRACLTNGTDFAYGAKVIVAEKLSVASNGVVCCWSDAFKAGEPLFEIGSLQLDEFGLITAEARGGHGSVNCSSLSSAGPHETGNGWTKGSGNGSTGGGHGGKGGHQTPGYVGDSRGGNTYDDAWEPILAGSPGGITGLYSGSGAGGGVINMTARGNMVVAGTICADGGKSRYTSNCAASGSGGSVFLKCQRLRSGPNAVISADGGRAQMWDSSNKAGTGGGGRIAIWTGYANLTPETPAKRIVRREGYPTYFAGAIHANAGTSPVLDVGTEAEIAEWIGQDGTLRWVDIMPTRGMTIIVH